MPGLCGRWCSRCQHISKHGKKHTHLAAVQVPHIQLVRLMVCVPQQKAVCVAIETARSRAYISFAHMRHIAPIAPRGLQTLWVGSTLRTCRRRVLASIQASIARCRQQPTSFQHTLVFDGHRLLQLQHALPASRRGRCSGFIHCLRRWNCCCKRCNETAQANQIKLL